METFEFEHLTGDVKDDFEEALKCYSFNCFKMHLLLCADVRSNLLQKNLGAKGKNKVKKTDRRFKKI